MRTKPTGGFNLDNTLTGLITSLQYRDSRLEGFFHRMIATFERRGIEFYYHTDLERLGRINAEAQGWSPLMPMFDPAVAPDGEVVWLEGRNVVGDAVMTVAVRLYHLESLQHGLGSLRLFYRDRVAAARSATEQCRCEVRSATQISGLVACSGAGWTRPDYRGLGFTEYVPRTVHGLACLLWGVRFVIALVHPTLVSKGMVERYGFSRAEQGVYWSGSAVEPNMPAWLLWMTRGECLADLANFGVPEEFVRATTV